MKIACIVPYVPNRIRTRSYNLILNLVSLGHEVEVFTIGSSSQDLADAQMLKAKCRDVHYYVQPVWRSLMCSAMALPSRQPLQAVYSWNEELAHNLASRLSNHAFDIVHVEHLRGSRYGTLVKAKFARLPIVWDSVDCISHLFRQAAGQRGGFFGQFITRFELPRTVRAEASLVHNFDHTLVTSPADKSALLELRQDGNHPSPISVLPNGVDLKYFQRDSSAQRDAATIVLSGKMSYHANIAMAKYLVAEIMPRVWKARPETHLCIVGKDPPLVIRELERNPRITVTGTVNDIRPFLWRASVSVAPLLYGAGIQNKILEAMASATPVVTTPRALSSLDAQPGRDLLVAQGAHEIAGAVLRLMDDPRLNHAVGDAGLDYVRQNHNWTSLARRLTDIYQSTLDGTALCLN